MKFSEIGKTRSPAVAGRFYPRDPLELRALVTALLAAAPTGAHEAPKAIIVPHAGYIYSGPIAASAYVQFRPASHLIKRIVLLGPSHHVAFLGVAASAFDAFATPLGLVRCDLESSRKLASLSQVRVLDEAHAYEHALEVQLPFLQVLLDDFQIVPLVIGEASTEQVGRVVDALWGGPETRFVISSDLSHYHDWQTARDLDQQTAEAIVALQPERIGEEQACGKIAIRGMLVAARNHGLTARTLDLRNSGDTAGPHRQVVGYGAFAFAEK